MGAKSFAGLIGCELPLQLAGMGAVGGDVALPAAVSEAGGLGMLGAAGMPADRLRTSLEGLRSSTTRPFGVNFLMPFLDRESVVIAAQLSAVVEFFYGDPDAALVELVHERGALAGWQVGSGDEAAAAESAGCDFVVVQGNEAGGHVRGERSLIELLRDVRTTASAPIVAAGGIGSAPDVRAILEAGASAVRVGTRFLAARESIAHPKYVDALIAARAEDTVITRAFAVGWDAPHRVLRASIAAARESADEYVGSVSSPDGEWPVRKYSTMPPTKDMSGNIAAMCMYAGTSVDHVHAQLGAAAIVAELCAEL